MYKLQIQNCSFVYSPPHPGTPFAAWFPRSIPGRRGRGARPFSLPRLRFWRRNQRAQPAGACRRQERVWRRRARRIIARSRGGKCRNQHSQPRGIHGTTVHPRGQSCEMRDANRRPRRLCNWRHRPRYAGISELSAPPGPLPFRMKCESAGQEKSTAALAAQSRGQRSRFRFVAPGRGRFVAPRARLTPARRGLRAGRPARTRLGRKRAPPPMRIALLRGGRRRARRASTRPRANRAKCATRIDGRAGCATGGTAPDTRAFPSCRRRRAPSRFA